MSTSSFNYYLNWKDIHVLQFNVKTEEVSLLTPEYLPLSICGISASFDMIRKFCSDRILMLNREYFKEIITSCGIDDQNPINICIVSKGLSFRDNYWITRVDSSDTWECVNLYNNPFSQVISRVAITGECDYVSIGDTLYTPELTNKGSRAKCYYRRNGSIFLIKKETQTEIANEIVSYYVAKALGVPCTFYKHITYYGESCSICKINTNYDNELIPYRDVVSLYGDSAFDTIMSVDLKNVILMCVFDYLTLNTDRNRDNHGLLRHKGSIVSLYPLFDHDSCFKGVSTQASYFPTKMSFERTLSFLKTLPEYSRIVNKQNVLYSIAMLEETILSYLDVTKYQSLLSRINDL